MLRTPAPVGTPGTVAVSAGTVVSPTTLTPSTGSGYAVGDTLLLFTCAQSGVTGTVATPSGWTSLVNVVGGFGRVALFAKVAASTSEAAPSVVWSALTTGSSGTPVQARIQAFSGLDDSVLASMADVVGASADGSASTSTSAGGAAITTIANGDLVLSLTTRRDDAFTTFTAPSGFTNVTAAMGTTSGVDFAMGWAYQVKTTAGSVTAPNFGLTGASSFASTGVVIALKAETVPKADTLSEDFNAALDTTTKWDTTAGVSLSSNRLLITPTTGYPSLGSHQTFDLVASSVACQLVQALNVGSGTTDTIFGVQVDANNEATFDINNGKLGLHSKTGGVSSDDTTITYNSTTHAWLRIRESGGNLLWDTSTDGATWTNRRTITAPAWVSASAVFVLFVAGYGSETTPGTALFDNLNQAAPTTYTDTCSGTIAFTGSKTEIRGYSDAPSGSIVTTGTKTEAKLVADTRSGTAALTGTVVEGKVYTNTCSGSIALSGSVAAESHGLGYVDSRSGTIPLSGTSTDDYHVVAAIVYNDITAAGPIILSGTRVESIGPIYRDFPTGEIRLSGIRTETADRPPVEVPIAAARLQVVSEKPPTRVSVNIVTPSMRTSRWAHDEPRGKDAISNLQWGSVAPGGFDQCSGVLSRNPNRHYEDLVPFSTVIVRDAGGGSVGEYRLEKTPLTSGDQSAISPAAVGWQAALEDDKGVSQIYIDRIVDHWATTSSRRKKWVGDNPNFFNPFAGQIDINPASKNLNTSSIDYNKIVPPTLSLSVQTLTQKLGMSGQHITPGDYTSPIGGHNVANPVTLSEAYYDAGVGNAIREVRGLLYSQVNMGYPGWEWTWWSGVDDEFNDASLYTTGPYAFTVGGEFSAFGGATPRRFALIQLYYTGAWPIDGSAAMTANWNVTMGWLRMIGDHSLLIRNPSDAEFAIAQANGWVDTRDVFNNMAQGVLASDVCKHAIDNFCPVLSAHEENIERSTYIIPHLSFIEKTTVAEIINQSTRFGAPPPDWFVWEKRQFHMYRRGVRGRHWRARVGPSKLSETGPDASRAWNSIFVSFTEGDKTRIVGPPGSGADYETPLLYDKSPDNPANQMRLSRRDILPMGDGDYATAIQIGQIFLQQANQLDRSGQATIVGHVLDDRGVLHPYHAMRAGDTIKFVDSSDPSPRRIVSVQCDDNTRSASIALDAPPEGLTALLERLGVALVPLGFG